MNLQCLKKLGICIYEENYYTEEIIQIQINTEEQSIKVINNKSDNKSTEKTTKNLTKEVDNKSIEVINKVLINEPDNKSVNKPDNKSINKPDNKEVNSNISSWYDTDKFNKIPATIDNDNFNHKNKVGKLKFSDINGLINSIKNNTISEVDAKNKINELNVEMN